MVVRWPRSTLVGRLRNPITVSRTPRQADSSRGRQWSILALHGIPKKVDGKVDPTKGYLFAVNEGGKLNKYFKGGFAKARELLPRFESDIANMNDFEDEGFETPDEGLDPIHEGDEEPGA